MSVPEKTVGPVCRDAKGLRPHKLCRVCCKVSIRCAAPESPKGPFSNKFVHHCAARTPITDQTPICSPNANSLQKCSFAAQTPICILNAFSLPKRISAAQTNVYQRCCSAKTAGLAVMEACDVRPSKDRRACWQGRKRIACPQTPQGQLLGEHTMPVPKKTEGPVSRDENELRQRKHRRACCRGGMRCLCPKDQKAGLQGRKRFACPQTPQGLLSGKHTMTVPEKTEGPVSRDANELRHRKHHRACYRRSMRYPYPKRP